MNGQGLERERATRFVNDHTEGVAIRLTGGKAIRVEEIWIYQLGLIQRVIPHDGTAVFERRIALRSARIIRPKSARRAVPAWSMRMLAYKDCQRYRGYVTNIATHAFEISMCDPELMEVRYT